jgi:ketosteroid isomerase-like protein
MRAFLATAAFLAAAPLAAQTAPPAPAPTYSQRDAAVRAGVDAFFAALRSPDKTALARQMVPDGMIFIHNRMGERPEVDVVPVVQHLENWLKSPPGLDERMLALSVLIDGDMAQVWGPYRFTVGGKTTHCGINSLSMVLTADGTWKVANTSFTMERPEFCDELGAPAEAPAP